MMQKLPKQLNRSDASADKKSRWYEHIKNRNYSDIKYSHCLTQSSQAEIG